jgi:hypothetical protein
MSCLPAEALTKAGLSVDLSAKALASAEASAQAGFRVSAEGGPASGGESCPLST